MSERVKHLNAAQERKDDEFYTMYSDVSKVFKAIMPYIKGLTILLPFDSIHSNFVKYLKQNTKHSKYKWVQANDYESLNEYYKRKDVVVISNPPFSKKKAILEHFEKYGTKFILILPYLFERPLLKYANCTIDLNIKKFLRPDKQVLEVKTLVYSNFINFSHKVRYDSNCNHDGAVSFYRRGNVYWDCFLKHPLEFSASTWLGHVFCTPIIYEKRGQFKRLRLSNQDCVNLYHYHKQIKEKLEGKQECKITITERI